MTLSEYFKKVEELVQRVQLEYYDQEAAEKEAVRIAKEFLKGRE